jgi:large subunit ribosomal protein L25
VSENQIAVEPREGTGKGVARKLRAEGRIPGVYYGGGAEPRSIHLDARALDRLLTASSAGMNTLIDLVGAGLGGKQVLVKELQRDPVKGTLVHADFFAIDLAKAIQVSVPLHVVGNAAGLLMGGIIDHALREVELECLPGAIPEEIPVDVTPLEIGMSLHVRDIPLPGGVTLISDPDLSVVSCAAPAAAEEAPVEGEEAAEEEAAEGAEEPKAEETAGESSEG